MRKAASSCRVTNCSGLKSPRVSPLAMPFSLAQAAACPYQAEGFTSPKETVAAGSGEPSMRQSTVTTVARVT